MLCLRCIVSLFLGQMHTDFNFNLVQRALVLEDYAPALVVGGLLVGKMVQEVWEKKRKKGKKIIIINKKKEKRGRVQRYYTNVTCFPLPTCFKP